mmetsp:Transcript_111290/g.193105  ORF Transcript_111290/g.193105 Transcript_111290/m.193105 type:complete len:212 (+) Transcript_111290:519-1154(+)
MWAAPLARVLVPQLMGPRVRGQMAVELYVGLQPDVTPQQHPMAREMLTVMVATRASFPGVLPKQVGTLVQVVCNPRVTESVRSSVGMLDGRLTARLVGRSIGVFVGRLAESLGARSLGMWAGDPCGRRAWGLSCAILGRPALGAHAVGLRSGLGHESRGGLWSTEPAVDLVPAGRQEEMAAGLDFSQVPALPSETQPMRRRGTGSGGRRLS